MAGELDAASPGQRRPFHDIHARAIMTLHVAIACSKVLRPPAVEVARNRERLEENLGHHDGAAEIQHHTTIVETRQDGGEPFEIAVAGSADGSAVGGRMLM